MSVARLVMHFTRCSAGSSPIRRRRSKVSVDVASLNLSRITMEAPIAPFILCGFKRSFTSFIASKKKSTRGIATPQHDIETIKSRLRAAEADHKTRVKEGPKG